MGKTLGLDRETARRIKRMNTKELDGYLTRVTDRSYDNGYEEGLVNGIALAGQALDEVLKTYAVDADAIKRAIGKHIAAAPEKAKQKILEEAKDTGKEKDKTE